MTRAKSISLPMLLLLRSSMGCREPQNLDFSGLLETVAQFDHSTVVRGLKEALSIGSR